MWVGFLDVSDGMIIFPSTFIYVKEKKKKKNPKVKWIPKHKVWAFFIKEKKKEKVVVFK